MPLKWAYFVRTYTIPTKKKKERRAICTAYSRPVSFPTSLFLWEHQNHVRVVNPFALFNRSDTSTTQPTCTQKTRDNPGFWRLDILYLSDTAHTPNEPGLLSGRGSGQTRKFNQLRGRGSIKEVNPLNKLSAINASLPFSDLFLHFNRFLIAHYGFIYNGSNESQKKLAPPWFEEFLSLPCALHNSALLHSQVFAFQREFTYRSERKLHARLHVRAARKRDLTSGCTAHVTNFFFAR